MGKLKSFMLAIGITAIVSTTLIIAPIIIGITFVLTIGGIAYFLIEDNRKHEASFKIPKAKVYNIKE